MDGVELIPAYLWTCPQCGTRRIASELVQMMSGDDLDDMPPEQRAAFGLPEFGPIESGLSVEAHSTPDVVRCVKCDVKYKVVVPQESMSGDD